MARPPKLFWDQIPAIAAAALRAFLGAPASSSSALAAATATATTAAAAA